MASLTESLTLANSVLLTQTLAHSCGSAVLENHYMVSLVASNGKHSIATPRKLDFSKPDEWPKWKKCFQ